MADDKTVIADPISFSVTASQRGTKRRVFLVQYTGSGFGKRYILEDAEVSVGRSPNATIRLDEQSVSRDHARFYLTEDVVEMEDRGSSNGTYVNDEKISEKVSLRNGDRIRLGTIVLTFYDSDNVEGFHLDHVYQKASIDNLTQMYNRQYLFDALNSEFRISTSSGSPLSIIYYDLDHFKKVNDSYGHSAGDAILKGSGEIVKNTIRKDDILGRVGGEEFIIVLPKTDQKTAAELAERIRAAHEAHTFSLESEDGDEKKNVDHTQTISMGVAQATKDLGQPDELIDLADKRLYRSKETGRNKVTAE